MVVARGQLARTRGRVHLIGALVMKVLIVVIVVVAVLVLIGIRAGGSDR